MKFVPMYSGGMDNNMPDKMMNIAQIFLSFFKIGVIGFGGGSAVIPVAEKELVQDRGAVEPEEYIKHTVIANITPGAQPVKLGATCGYQLGGVSGSLAGAYAVMLPGVLLTLAVMSLFSIMGTSAIQYFNYASVGITAFIVFLLSSYVVKTVGGEGRRANLLLCLGGFILTGGGELRHLLRMLTGLDDTVWGLPLFDISTIDLMLVSFFMIIMLGKLNSRAELAGCFIVSTLYSFCVGTMGKLYGADSFSGILLGAMGLLLCVALIWRRSTDVGKATIAISRQAGITIAILLIIPIVLTLFAALLWQGRGIISFIANVCLSTLTSFGGGAAYISVADGIFVQGGYVAPELFYTRLVPVANAMPGPVLVKIASGMGYLYGTQGGSVAAGWAVAAAAAAASIGTCSAVAVLVMQLYDSIGGSVFIHNLKKYIIPVICGMLISTSMSMLYEGMKITGEKGIAGFISLPLMLGMVLVINLLSKKYRLHDVILLLGAAGLGLGVLVLL